MSTSYVYNLIMHVIALALTFNDSRFGRGSLFDVNDRRNETTEGSHGQYVGPTLISSHLQPLSV